MQQYKEKKKEQIQKHFAGEFAYYFTFLVNLLCCSLQLIELIWTANSEL